jgi:hypothetical protein
MGVRTRRAAYDWRLALYDSYIGYLKSLMRAGHHYCGEIDVETLHEGWRYLREERQQELSAAGRSHDAQKLTGNAAAE